MRLIHLFKYIKHRSTQQTIRVPRNAKMGADWVRYVPRNILTCHLCQLAVYENNDSTFGHSFYHGKVQILSKCPVSLREFEDLLERAEE